MLKDVSLEEAVSLLAEALPRPTRDEVSLDDALGRVLAADLASRADHPSLDDSALDGYAVRAADTAGASGDAPRRLRVVAEVPAGSPWGGTVREGEAARIFTGAPVPAGADGIVAVEHTREEGGDVLVLRPARPEIRARGQDLRAGEVYLRRGTRLAPAHVALAAAMGHARLPVLERPRLAVLATGDELLQPGTDLPPGGVYDSNSYGLVALARAAGAEARRLDGVADDLPALRDALESAGDAHLVLTSGGVSMGARDFVRHLLEREGEVRFWRVRLKPGGPPLLGSWRGRTVFGVPGNPVSAMVVFTVIVRPALHAAWGISGAPYEKVLATAATPFRGAGAKVALQRGTLAAQGSGWTVSAHANQSSGVLRSLSESNALVVVPPGSEVAPGDTVEAIRL
ncbi:MAG TPA: gephyrin-like molybdotransferase Glp [Deinococcales bacterium]|nr:gephyrin-like molybdotransferase Glp [Deinococcales bacterium]